MIAGNCFWESLSPQVRDFFLPWIERQDDSCLFAYSLGDKNRAEEYWIEGGIKVPSTVGIWLAGAYFPASPRNLFISTSAIEILSFVQMHPVWLSHPGSTVFAALGLVPGRNQLNELKQRFPQAKIHTLFDADLTGRVADCKIALWVKNKEAPFFLSNDHVQISYCGREFEIHSSSFSLSRFEKVSGLRSALRTHKPKNGYSSFYELI